MDKRKISLALLLTMLLSNIVSCGSSSDTTSDTTTAGGDTTPEVTTEAELTDGLPEKDMEGFQFNILHCAQDSLTWAYVELDAEDETGDLINDAIYARNVAIEERFNADLVFTTGTFTETSNQYQTTVLSGDNPYDIIMVYGIYGINNVDYQADMNVIPHVNFDAAWWNPNATSEFNIGGKQLAAAGNFSLSYVSTANCLLFNKRLYADLNTGENLYELVREGKWTIDKFFKIAADAVQDVNGDTKIGEGDIAGCTGTVKAVNHMFVIGAGFHYVTKDKDGYPEFNVSKNEKLVSYLEKIVNLQTNNVGAYLQPSPANSNTHLVSFADGGCLFFNCWPQNIDGGEVGLRDMKDDFGILPAPKYDENQEKYYSNMANGEVATLPRSYDPDRLDNIGILLEAMSFYTQHEIVPVYKEVLLDVKLTRDEDSLEMLDYVFDGVTYDFGINIWQDQLGNKVFTNEIYIPLSTNIVSTLETYETSIKADFDKLRESVEAMP